MNTRDEAKETLAPGMIDVAAGAEDPWSVKLLDTSLLNSAKDASYSVLHDVRPAEMNCIPHLYGRKNSFV